MLETKWGNIIDKSRYKSKDQEVTIERVNKITLNYVDNIKIQRDNGIK